MWDRDLVGTHIMVPLDGSQLAEQALPVAVHAASGLHATLVLVRVTRPAARSPGRAGPDETTGQVTEPAGHSGDDEQHAAREYLDSIALPLRQRGVHVQVITQVGAAAPTLVDLLAPLDIGLVIMTTHGRTGMARFALGSVAYHLVHASHVPVLLRRQPLDARWVPSVLHPDSSAIHDIQLARALVPLDGTTRAEAALDVVAALAGYVSHELTVLRVVPLRSDAETERTMEEAERYLAEVSGRLVDRLAGRAAVETKVLGGDPAEQIIRCAGQDYDLLVMATRGEIGTRRWVFGSVADRVLHESVIPLVLVHAS